jgi:hypothetical protein
VFSCPISGGLPQDRTTASLCNIRCDCLQGCPGVLGVAIDLLLNLGAESVDADSYHLIEAQRPGGKLLAGEGFTEYPEKKWISELYQRGGEVGSPDAEL